MFQYYVIYCFLLLLMCQRHGQLNLLRIKSASLQTFLELHFSWYYHKFKFVFFHSIRQNPSQPLTQLFWQSVFFKWVIHLRYFSQGEGLMKMGTWEDGNLERHESVQQPWPGGLKRALSSVLILVVPLAVELRSALGRSCVWSASWIKVCWGSC